MVQVAVYNQLSVALPERLAGISGFCLRIEVAVLVGIGVRAWLEHESCIQATDFHQAVRFGWRRTPNFGIDVLLRPHWIARCRGS